MADTWNRLEVEAVVATYLAMYELEVLNRPYVKTEYIRSLEGQLDKRSEASIEYKCGNISAALEELGLPFIDGFKPYRNYQQLVLEVVSDRVRERRGLLDLIKATAQQAGVVPQVEDILAALGEPPEKPEKPYPDRGAGSSPPVPLDYVALEAWNQSLGRAGEEFVLRFERARLTRGGQENLADRIEWASIERGDWLGFDIRSYETDGSDRFIEVKTTRYGRRTPFFASRNEVRTSMDLDRSYHLYRAFAFDRGAKLFILPGRLDRSCSLDPLTFEARVA